MVSVHFFINSVFGFIFSKVYFLSLDLSRPSIIVLRHLLREAVVLSDSKKMSIFKLSVLGFGLIDSHSGHRNFCVTHSYSNTSHQSVKINYANMAF